MSVRVKLYAAPVLLCLFLPVPASAADSTAEAREAASRWDRIYNSGDMDGLERLYVADAVVIPKGAAVSGAEGIRTFFASLKAKGFDEHKTTVNAAQVKGNLLLVTGRWAMTGPGDGGARKSFEGNWVNVLERQGDGWRTVLHTWN